MDSQPPRPHDRSELLNLSTVGAPSYAVARLHAVQLAEAVGCLVEAFPSGSGALLATRMRQAATSVLEELGAPGIHAPLPSLHDRLARAEAHLADLVSHASIAADLGYCATADAISVRDRARSLGRQTYVLRTGS